MKTIKLILAAAALGAALAVQAVTTYTVSNTNSSNSVANSLPWALDQVAQNTKVTSPSGGVFRITFAPAVYGCQIPMRSSVVTLKSIQAKVVLDGTGSGVTIVDPSGATGSSSAYMFDIEISGASLIVSNLTFSISRSLVKSYGGKIEIEGCRFENCKPVDSLIRRETIGHAGYTKIERTTFIDNATSGAGDMAKGSCVNVSTGRLMLNHCSFINNRSAKAGGAVYSNTTNLSVIANCSFVHNNSETDDGEAVYFDASTKQGFLIESMFFGNDDGDDVYACASGGVARVSLYNCGYERIATDSGAGFKDNSNPVTDVTCEDVCGTETPRYASCIVNGVRQTAPFPQPSYSGNEGAYTFQHTADWTLAGLVARTTGSSLSLNQKLWGDTGTLFMGTMDPVDLFGTAKPTARTGRNPTVGAVQYGQEAPSLTVTMLEDLDCPVDNEISFREAVRYASLYADLAVDGRAAITFAPSILAQAVDGKLAIPVTEGDIVVDGELTNSTLVVASPEGLRLDFCGKTNGTARVAAGRLFKLAQNAKLELHDLDIENFQPVYGSGGALYLEGGNTVVASNVCFRMNGVSRFEAGGAIFAGEGSTLKTYGSAFDRNEAGCCGGAVYIADSIEPAYAHFERTTFHRNETQSALDDEGGAVYVGGGRVVFVNTSFHMNMGHTAALQVRRNATVTMINSFVTGSIAEENVEDTSGTAIYVADDETTTFRLVNSVVGGYRSASQLNRGYCQLRMGANATKLFVNSIVSANNEIELADGQTKTWVEYTERELYDYVFMSGVSSNLEIHGVEQRFVRPNYRGPLFGAGMEIQHNAAWTQIRACYGVASPRTFLGQTMITVCGSPRVGTSLETLDTDLRDKNWSDVLATPARQRSIGPIWGINSTDAKRNLDYRAEKVDGVWQITLPSDYDARQYLPQICGGHFVERIRFSAGVSAFDPLRAVTAQTVSEYAVEEGSTTFKAASGALYSADGRTFVALPPDYQLGGILVEAGVETVASNAFAAINQNIQYSGYGFEVKLPDSVTTLEDGAFAGLVNVDLYFYGMTAPECTDAVFADSSNIHVFVPYGSTGWDGNPGSTTLPESWHGDGVLLEHWSAGEWPSLEVTTLEDVVDPTDGLISLREAIDYAAHYPSLFENNRAEITFAPGLPVDEESGKMEIELTLGEIMLVDEGVLGGRTLVVSVPDGQMLALVGASAAQAHRRCFFVGADTRLELRNVEIRQFDCSGDDVDERYGGAVYLGWGCGFVASNCYFRGNGPASDVADSSATEGGAVYVRQCCDARFYDCSFYSNKAAIGSAVSFEDSASDSVPFVLFERTSFAQNNSYLPNAEQDWGGAVHVGILGRVVFNTCSFVANRGHISDISIRAQADVTMVNSSVSDSIAQKGNDDTTGAAIFVDEEWGTTFRAVNSVIGGYRDSADREKGYRMIKGLTSANCSIEDAGGAQIEVVNTIIAKPTVSQADSVSAWVEYYEEDFTNYVYDVTANNTTALCQPFRRTKTDAPKYFRPLGRESVLCGTGVTIYHDADWENVAWRYGDEELHEFLGDAAEATIPVTRDLLGNDWVGSLGLSARQRNIGPLGAWDLAGDFETAARAVPDYRRTCIVNIDWEGDCRIVLATERKCLPPICGGLIVSEVEVGPAVTAFDPGCVVSAPEVSSYVAGENAHYTSMGGCLYTDTPDGKVFVAAPPSRLNVCVQNGTCGVGVDAFRYARELDTVSLPASLRFIEGGAFAGCNFDLYLNSMSAPAYAPTSFLGCDSRYHVYVPEGSKGWNGDPNSSVLPAKWPAEDGVDGLPVESYRPEDYPSLVVTTCEDVEDCYDGVISLREAVGSLSSSSLIDDRRAVITFDPALANANGVIDLSFDDGSGAMTIMPESENMSIVIAAPAGCRVHIRGCDGGEGCVGESGLFELATIGGTITFAGLDIEGFSSGCAAAIWSDWDSAYIGELVISNCTFRNCWSESGDGGAVCVSALKATVVDSVFEGNHQCGEDGAGGGLALRGCGWNSIAGEARVERCSFTGNYARKGGGLAIFGCEDKDRMAVVNTSILDNETSDTGAAVWVGGLGTATFTHVSAFDNGSTYDGDALVQAVAHEVGTKVELVNSVIVSASYDKGTKPYVDRDIIFGSDEDLTTVRAANSVFGKSQKRGSAPSEIIVDCTLVLSDLTDWFNAASTVTNALTRLPMRVRTPVAGGSATTRTLAATDVTLDLLGLARTADFNAVGALAADPADRPLSGYAAWAAAQGLTGTDAEWNATPAKWGGKWANAFVYTYGEGLAAGALLIRSITLDALGKPVIETAPVVEGHDDFTSSVIGVETLDDWTSPVELERSGDIWTLPVGASAHFFRVRLSE